MRRLAAPIAALLLAVALAGAASGAPPMQGPAGSNDYRHAQIFPVMDTLAIPNNRTRGIYLIYPATGTVRAPIDSLLELWRNGGAVPDFRRIKHIIILHDSVDEEQWGITIFKGGTYPGTTHSQLVTQPYQVLDLPFEADSVQIQGVSPKPGATQVDLTYICW